MNHSATERPASQNQSIKVLIAEDDAALRQLLSVSLKHDGYQVYTAKNGQEAMERFAEQAMDVILLDVAMPVMDGFDVCTELRKKSDVPIIFITAQSRIDDLVLGIELGADSYLRKPFSIQELRARIQAVLRRMRQSAHHHEHHVLSARDLSLDTKNMVVTLRSEPVTLTPTEFRLLSYLMQNPDRLLTKLEVQTAVWAYESSDDVNFIRVTIRRLRSKIEDDPANPRYIKTVHGLGYLFSTTLS